MVTLMRNKMLTAEGILLPSEWDDNGQVLGLTFFTFDEKAYPVEPCDLWQELLNVVREELRIEGYLKWKQGRKRIYIKTFHPFTDH